MYFVTFPVPKIVAFRFEWQSLQTCMMKIQKRCIYLSISSQEIPKATSECKQVKEKSLPKSRNKNTKRLYKIPNHIGE